MNYDSRSMEDRNVESKEDYKGPVQRGFRGKEY